MSRIKGWGFRAFCCSLLVMQAAFATTDEQDSLSAVWKKKFVVGITLTQTSYSNWEKGGQNSISWNTRIDGELSRSCDDWELIITNLMVFGQLKNEKEAPRNTMDKIDIDGTLTRKKGLFVNPYFGIGFLSQFCRGYDYKTAPPVAKSDFFDPAYITQSLGARFKYRKSMNSQLGLGIRETFTRSFRQYSDNPKTEKKEPVKVETGIESKTRLDTQVLENLSVRSKLELFSSFEEIDVIDMRWDTLFSAKLNSYVVITLNLQVNYDKTLIDKAQLKEVAGVGFSYQIF